MKLCWDNIENIRLTKKGNLHDFTKKITYYLYNCEECNNEYLSKSLNGRFCCKSCSTRNMMKSKSARENISEKVKKQWENTSHKKYVSNTMKEKWKDTNSIFNKKETRKKMSNMAKKRCKNIRHFRKEGVSPFNTYSNQLKKYEEIRKCPKDIEVLEVKCFKCGEWFKPSYNSVVNRIQYIKGEGKRKVESRFYCSDQCKNSCSIYHKSVETLMKEDAMRAGRLSWLELGREVQPDLRKMVLERDNNECVKCGNTNDLQCHHIYPVAIEPLLSADVDNCITLCVDCHKEVHTKDGCKTHQLKLEEC